jgi:hypothetical protein
MNNFNSEGFSDGDWEGRSETEWNEFDWSRYLKNSEEEVLKFINTYNAFVQQPDRLDATASAMGWDAEDWAPDEVGGDEDDPFETEASADLEEDDFSNWEPYTMHRHPLYVSTRALFVYLNFATEHFIGEHGGSIKPSALMRFIQGVHQAELEAILGIQALEMGDYSLVVTHFKRAAGQLNTFLGLLENFSHTDEKLRIEFLQCMRIRIFDLRDIWLRVMRDCRFDQYQG